MYVCTFTIRDCDGTIKFWLANSGINVTCVRIIVFLSLCSVIECLATVDPVAT